MSDIRSLYLHVPFCERKCEYCDFTSVAGVRGADAYMTALAREIGLLGEAFPGLTLDTVFVGGGTPSLVEPHQLHAVMDAVRRSFTLTPAAELTLEANPSSTDANRAREWLAAGFTRVSIGAQSTHDDVLRFLGRVHDSHAALGAVRAVRDAGFTSVNCDLIYAVPGLDDDRWRATLRAVTAAGVDHVSCYELTVEEGTPLHRSVRRGAVTPVDAEVALRQHAIALDELHRAGLQQYEVSNFARPGEQSRHNLAYWHNAFYLAAGVGAHGHVPAATAPRIGIEPDAGAVAVRYWHGRGIGAYGEAIGARRLPIAGHESIDAPTHEMERLMVGLRLTSGITIAEPSTRDRAEALRRGGLVRFDGDLIRVTSHGEDVLNAVVAQLVAA